MFCEVFSTVKPKAIKILRVNEDFEHNVLKVKAALRFNFKEAIIQTEQYDENGEIETVEQQGWKYYETVADFVFNFQDKANLVELLKNEYTKYQEELEEYLSLKEISVPEEIDV